MGLKMRFLRRKRKKCFVTLVGSSHKLAVKDISPMGCKVSVSEDFNLPGSEGSFILEFPDSGIEFRFHGRLIWRGQNHAGIKFEEFHSGGRLKLAFLICNQDKSLAA